MADVNIIIGFNDRGISRRLKGGLGVALREFTTYHVGVLKQAFSNKGHQHHGGLPWAPRKKPVPHPLMVKTGKLRRSISGTVDQDRMIFSSNDPKAPYHQYGTKNMVARPIIVFNQSDKNDFQKNLKQRLIRHLNGGN